MAIDTMRGTVIARTEQGLQMTERYRVTVSGSDERDAAWKVITHAGLPVINDVVTFGVSPDEQYLRCRDVTPGQLWDREGGGQAAVVTAVWRQQATATPLIISPGQDEDNPDKDGDALFSSRAFTEQVESSFDGTGAEILLSREVGGTQSPAKFPKRIARGVIIAQRWEEDYPQSRLDTFPSRINSDTFLGYAANQVMCTQIAAETRNNGQSYLVRYEFEIDTLNEFEVLAGLTDPDSGLLLPGPIPSSHKQMVQPQPAVAFASLSLSLP